MKKKLLVIDDEPCIRLILEHYFSSLFVVISKSNGVDAMDWLQDGNIADIIVADMDMPYMNGLEFVRQIRASFFYKEIPLIMLSGNDSSRDKIRCLREGADDYMVKPFNPEELDVRIGNILRRIGV
ncbi:response regulator [soil metagenome]|jgi:DNA-binding response OmpR family regulator